MAKKKKNSNYVTEKTIAAKEQKAEQKLKEKKAKTVKIVAISVGAVLAFAAIIVGILLGVGAFDYDPDPTYHATFTFDSGESLHIELYGNDAPETVKHFTKLCESGYYDGRSAHTLINSLLYVGMVDAGNGESGIKGEFELNGFKNKIPMKKGTVCMARGESYDSAYGQFFVLTKNKSSLKGEYAAFGSVTNLDVLETLVDRIEVDENGRVTNAPVITGVSLHEAHH